MQRRCTSGTSIPVFPQVEHHRLREPLHFLITSIQIISMDSSLLFFFCFSSTCLLKKFKPSSIDLSMDVWFGRMWDCRGFELGPYISKVGGGAISTPLPLTSSWPWSSSSTMGTGSILTGSSSLYSWYRRFFWIVLRGSCDGGGANSCILSDLFFSTHSSCVMILGVLSFPMSHGLTVVAFLTSRLNSSGGSGFFSSSLTSTIKSLS